MRRLGLVPCLAAVWPPSADAIDNPEEFPNLLAGSFTDGQSFSTGNTLPLVARPWGFNHFAPQTNDGNSAWWFRGDAHEFHWMRLTHQPSPWIGDWAWLLFGPQMGGRVDEPVMFFEPWGAYIKPHSFDATLGPDNMRVQLTPTMHGAVMKVTFPSFNPRRIPKRICFKLPPRGNPRTLISNPARLDSSNEQEMSLELTTSRAEDVPRDFAMRVRAEVAMELLKKPLPQDQRISKGVVTNCFEFDHEEVEVTVRLATSLISSQQAKLNLDREIGKRSFEEVEQESRQVWRELLNRVEVVDPGPMTFETMRRLQSFYTGLYRALIFPRRLDEVDANGKVVHYNPYNANGGVFDGPLVTDNGFWDTFRTVYPMLSLTHPEELGEIIAGWLNAYKYGGWLPEWSSPSYRDCMVGTYADVVVADAILKDIPGFDVNTAWEAMAKDSFVMGGGKKQGGKKFFIEYSRESFIPAEKTADSVSGTLDYAFSDFAVSLVADRLGKKSEAQQLRQRAMKARRTLFDSSSGLFRPTMRGGAQRQDNPQQWGAGYVEGSAWHHSFPAFDLEGLVELHGSREKLALKIKEMIDTPGSFSPGTYGRPIHEMEEMRALGLGQYAHSNQPVHHILWLLPALDEGKAECAAASEQEPPPNVFCPKRYSEKMVDIVLHKAYGLDFFSGDEDNGEMGAWYVLAGLGLFEPAPGTYHGYALGSPLFRRIDLHRKGDPDKAVLSIRSNQAGTKEAIHVSRVQLNGKDVGAPAKGGELGWKVQYKRLAEAMPGGVLRFITGSEPVVEEPAASATGGNGSSSGADSEALRRRIRGLEGQIEQQRHQIAALDREKALARTANNPAPPPPPPPPPAVGGMSHGGGSAEGSQLAEQQHSRIRELETQLATHFKHKTDTDTDVGLTFMVQAAFLILLMVNILLWVVCVGFRRSKADPGSNGSSKKDKKGRNKVKHAHQEV
eukprot:TRINITY_DN42160_c0_g2_i1.p1 TRINITY_DN42160_c0_g2~~TRINITY_DN42160_c0_g2_i1.p1  ORF type:complete len:954 (+),score=230.99 TRINITY_DN42160_c0_g2_i1:73-2934(+)